MPIALPELDNKTYEELVEEARAAIPTIDPAWTDHNPSDPGIALVELFAWLTEMLVYRTGRIPEASTRTFLRILDVEGAGSRQALPLDEAVHGAIVDLRERYRAVSLDDFEYIARHHWPISSIAAAHDATAGSPGAPASALAQVRALSGCDLTDALSPQWDRTGHVSLVVVPRHVPGAPPGSDAARWPLPAQALRDAIELFMRSRLLAGTRFHAVAPAYVSMSLTATLHIKDDARAADVRSAAATALEAYFDPLEGGRGGGGWPFGRGVYVSEIYATLDGVRGVEFADAVVLSAPGVPPERIVGAPGSPDAVLLQPHQLPRFEVEAGDLVIKERVGDAWVEVT
ncbi:hypothetical protein WME90_39490 [Sorangium sp. So ce375]|uniref:hypothetical protein n=1 Tax=Sorangium sp. So ce375 TaxID=3133306 RepID=UPI003F5C477E